MSSILWTFESDVPDHPREGDSVRIWFSTDDGYPVFEGVTEAHSYKAIPELRSWARAQFADPAFVDRAFEIAEEDLWDEVA